MLDQILNKTIRHSDVAKRRTTHLIFGANLSDEELLWIYNAGWELSNYGECRAKNIIHNSYYNYPSSYIAFNPNNNDVKLLLELRL